MKDYYLSIMNLDKLPFDNLNVGFAVNHAIDKSTIIQSSPKVLVFPLKTYSTYTMAYNIFPQRCPTGTPISHIQRLRLSAIKLRI